MTIDAVQIMRETSIARVEYRRAVNSTNDRVVQCASQGATELPLLVVADEQTAGRGRGGNRWWTGPGSLAFSLLVDAQTVAARASRSPLVALATAVAVVDAVAPLLPSHQVGIHWPNDVHVRAGNCPNFRLSEKGALPLDRKLTGILVEVLPDRRHVIGIGLNVNNTMADAPPELRNTVATLRDLQEKELDRTQVLIDVLRCLEQEFSRLRDDATKVAARANSLCLQRGQTMILAWTDRKITGVCRGIADDGALLLETPTGTERFTSGTTATTDKGDILL
jgi:BirA family transcriptional regulator, biotin operon repressor / biotin---[acetyl-CoA-carboxylase] ligase